MKERKITASKLTPSQLVKQQLTGNGFFEEALEKPRIIEFLNLADYSINTQSFVNIDQPLFQAVPPVIQFSDYEPLQIKEKVFKLRNKDRFSRRVKIIQPDSKLFQVMIPNDTKTKLQSGTKVAAGMETKFVIRFSPEAKIDYKYELIVVTEREKFIVPIVAVGKRAMIDFPDVLDFGACPVKFSTQKPVIIRNLGEKTTKWNLQLPAGFATNQKEGVLEPGKNQQILIKFYPSQAKLYRSMAKLQYDKLQAYVELTGSGQLSNVYLSKPVVSMEQSYIGLQSQQTLHIINKSNVKVNFEWRAFASQKQERPKKELLYHQLQQEEAEELMLLREVINSQQQKQEDLQDINDSSSEEQVDPRQYLQRKRKRGQLAVNRKYKTIKKAIEDDLFLFQDSIFKIQPLVGEIWPNSQITITVTFMPIESRMYECPAYCNVSCAEERLPLKLKGEGLGPKAYLTQQQINFGDIFVNQPIRQTVQIQNRGEIPCHFTLIKPERAFAKMFNFSVVEKTLQVGENCSIEINFKSSIPGQFKQKFKWNLHGSDRNLQMTFLGHVIAPTFEFVDPNDTLKAKPQISFGKVSYDFDYKQFITLKNTSSVQFNYNLKIQSENKILQNEFRINPQSGKIPEKSQRLIEIQFTPKSVKKYETVMTIDIEGVGNDMLSVPIKADCQVPLVDIAPAQKVQFPEACLNYPETKSIILNNHSDIKAKFNIIPQSEESKVLAKYTVSPQSGIIDEKSSKELQITLITSKLGQITLPLNVNIIGTNNNQPHLLNIWANSDGPKVAVTPQELDFEQVQVLKDYFQKVTIVNNSKIKAEFHAFTRQKISIFKPKIKHAFLQPGQRLQFDVVCNADDSSKFNDILHFVVKDGKDRDVVLKARGVGSTIYCDDNLEALNFGTIYTYKTAVKEIFIQNRGRKAQKITWQRKKLVDKKKNKDEKEKPVEEETVFSIDPETQTIPPKYGRYFRFVAMSQKKGKIIQEFNLLSQVGNERKANQLKTMVIEGQFTQPNLIYSQKKLNFKYIWQVADKDQKVLPLEKTLELTSGSSLPLDFTLKVSPPFSVSEQVHFLEPGASTKIKVQFDPNYKVDRVSGILNGKINVVFADHPYRETVELVGEVCFPNLKLEASLVNFGAILNDTTKKISMLMKNVSQMPVAYEWAFLQQQILGEEERMNLSSTSQFLPGSIPINEVFDILPLSGKLDPGQVQEVQFIYNAQGGILYRTTALCHVEGGPNYQVKLEGDSSMISGKISDKQLDFGVLKFCDWSTKQIFLENTGKVTYEFKVSVTDVKRKAFLQISPMNGKIAGGQKQKITIRVCPTMPEIFVQEFEIQMGYYDPQKIVVKGEGVYPSLLCQFPRSQNPEFDTKLKEQVDKYTKEYQSYNRKMSKDKSKKKQKEMKSIEQFRHEVEKEMDRKQYCKLINQAIETYQKPQKPPANNIQTKLFEKIYLTSWLCDFGNVIVGSTQRKQLKFKNVGDQPIQMFFDLKPIKASQYNITPDKSKLAPGEQVNVVVTLATKKNSKFGKLKSSVVLEVKNGAKYKLQLISNLTIPQIVVDGINQGILDFGKVLCGQRKTITLRFLNLKQIPCEWSLNLKEPVPSPADKDKDLQLKYELKPSSGRIPSGGFQMVKVLFIPTQQKQYLTKFPIKIQENPKVLNIDLKGVGTCITLDVKQPKLKIGPVLPYDNKAFALLQISNPTQYPTELINLDFDKKFKEDIQTLAIYEEIKNGGNAEINKRVVFLPTRQVGANLWPEVVSTVSKKNKVDELKKKLQTTTDEAEKQNIQKQIDTLNTVVPQIQYPRKVDSDKILHLVLTGYPISGKSHIASTISQLHKRCLIKMDELIQWVLDSGSELGAKIKKHLEDRRKQYELAVQERQKAFKKAGKKAKQLQDKLGPANEAMYDHLPESFWIEAVKQRIKHPECGAGCVFDTLKSKHLPNNELLMINIIMKAVGNQAFSIIDVDGIVKQAPQQNQDAKSEFKKSETSQIQNMTSKNFVGTKTIAEIDKEQEDEIKLEVKQLSEEQNKKYQEKRTNIAKLIKNQYEGNLEVIMFKDPIFEDKKQPENDESKKLPAHLGARQIIQFPIHLNSIDQRNAVKKIIPAPQYNDPMKQPLPEAQFHEVINKHSGKFFESKLLKQFHIFTPKEKYAPYKKPQKKDEKKDKRGDKKGKTIKVEPQVQAPPVVEVNAEQLSKDDTRWVIPPETTLKLYVKFFSKLQGTFQSLLTFQNTFNLKKTQVPLTAKTQFPTLSNVPKTLFWNLKKTRPTTCPENYLSKVFVLGQNCFDFGPLLIGKNSQKKNQKDIIAVNSTTFKLVNIGHYPAEIQIALLSSIMENEPGYKKGVFSVQFDKCVIQPDEPPKELRVWSIPDQPKAFIDELIIMVKNNPTPITVPLKCLGSKPIIEVKQGSPIKFTRILLNQSIKRELKLHNTSAIPIKFRLEGCEKLPQEFHVMIKQGKLKPNEQISIDFNFKAIKQQKFNESLKLIAEDTENLSIMSQPIDIPIEAEAFDISVDLKFPNQNTENLLDFGAIRVGDYKDQNFIVKNIGLYVVKISFTIKKKLYKDCFRIQPMQFQLQPNASKEVLVRFSSLKQVKLKTNNNNTDIFMQILEGKTLETHRSVPINVSVNSVFSNYSIVPLKNMNFGPIQFNESKTRVFEIKNEGLFEFNYSIFDFANQEFRKELLENLQKERQAKLQAANTLPVPGGAADKKGGKKQVKQVKKDAKKGGKGGKGEPENSLKIGQWTITPASGTVAPDGSATVEVKFTGNGQKLFEQKIAVDIQNRNPSDQPNGILYQLVAQSCIPGINTRNFESIFEEQLVLPSQHHSTNVTNLVKSNVFFVEQRVFNFGTLVPSKVPEGIVEKIKIENSNKVTCNVKFDVRKKTPNAIQQFAFEVEPKQFKIPPHQYHYVKIIFKPTIMASYAGLFEAVVQNGDQEPKTHKLTFDLKGQGALPTLRVEKPKEFLDERTILLKFPKTRVGKTNTQQISLKNDGSIPATAKFDLVPSQNFRFLDNTTISLNPKTYSVFNVEFKPLEVGNKQWDITASTLLNQFETMRFKIQGQAYYEDILFENLPLEEQDKINFDDCIIGEQKRVTFSLRNNSTSTIKFNWASNDDFKFIPNTGHIAPKSIKSITVVFKSSKTITHKQLPIPCETVQIKQNTQQYIDWDDSMTVKRFVTKTQHEWILKKKQQEKKRKEQEAEAAKKGGKKDAKKAPKQEQKKPDEKPPQPKQGEEADIMIEQVIKQPENAVVEKTEKSLTLKASAVSDYSKYQIQSRKIDFLPTMMYTSRVHKFSIKNTSTIKMNYNCKIVSAQTGKIDSGFFTVAPHSGTVMPGCDQHFTVKFSPTEVEQNNDRLLVVGIKNLDPALQKLIIQLNGDTQRPICHFEIPPSKYREKRPDIEAKYNIIQFQSLGTKVKNTKRFYVVNPTSLAYDYEWKKIDDNKDSNFGFFRCATSKGTILSGKKAEMIFQYTPDLVGTHESYWVFEIPSQKIVQYFMLVGDVVEPNIFFDIGKINFGPLLLGGKNREIVSLKNLEEVPLAFNFDKQSIRGDLDSLSSLKVQPMSGVVPSGGQAKIEVTFEPKVSKQFNYNLACNVTRRSRPICVNVKGIGYVLSHSVHINDRPNVLNKNEKTQVNFGNIFVNQTKVKTLTIQNNGDFNFDFAIKSNSPYQFLNISKEFGTVRKNEKFVIDLQFAPKDEFAFKSNAFLTLSIISGPTYTFQLRGTAKKPGVQFSFFNYDFGPCFVLKQPLSITAYLQVRNRENTAMTIESLFEKTDYLDVKIPSGEVVLPVQIASVKNKKGVIEKIQKNVLKIPIVFTPRQMIKYQDTLTFDINSLNKIQVKIKGQGIPLKLEVEKTQDQNVDFGITKVGHDDTRIVGIVNNSKKKIEITFNVDNQLEQLKKMFINIGVSPTQTIIIHPRQKYDLEVSFKPTMRISPFKAELIYKIVDNQEKRKLLNVFTTAHGIQMKLMEDTVGFGTVVINSKISKTIQLSNFGDIPSKFQWDTKFCGKYFTISPEKGHLNAHEDILFDVTFHPNVVDNDIKFKVKCSVDGMDPLFVNLIGKCIPQHNDTIQEIKFDCMVRKEAIQKVTLKNPTPKLWKIKASISSNQKYNYFSGNDFVEVPANGQTDYEVKYLPLTMTANQQQPNIKEATHNASLFFPIPDGTALMYKLTGKSTPPNVLQTFDLNTKAKKNLVHLIPIKNWLNVSQRFNVSWKFDVEDKTVFINAANTFDVAGDSSKDYKLSIYALKACNAKFTIFFKNPNTHQFISFRVNLTVTPADPMEIIQLSSLVRETTHKLITLQNPLPHPVEIKKQMMVVESDVLFLSPNTFTIPAKSEFGFQIIFRPLLAKQENSKITIKSPDLGEFAYPLKLIGQPSNSDRVMNFKAALGGQITQKLKFIHFGKKASVYTCRVEKIGQKTQQQVDPKAKVPAVVSDFTVETPTINVPGSENFEGVEGSVNVKFEPSGMGDSISQLIISSPDGGQYVTTLNGVSTAPQPKGPYKISAKPPPIDFKNPFFEAYQFVVRIDNPAFTSTVKSPVKVDGKKVLSINLAYKAVQGFSANGRLTISAGQNLTWVFYLQGE